MYCLWGFLNNGSATKSLSVFAPIPLLLIANPLTILQGSLRVFSFSAAGDYV